MAARALSLTIWCDAKFAAAPTRRLMEGVRPHRLIFSEQVPGHAPPARGGDSAPEAAEVFWGQPPPADCLRSSRLRWVELTSAGYTRYDTSEFRQAFAARGTILTNASMVFADPCAQHVLAMMLAFGRRLLPAYQSQRTDHAWNYLERRAESRLLTGQTVLMLGYGAIGRRLATLLEPFGMTLYAVRRHMRSEPKVHIVSEEELGSVWPLADHVVDLLPEAESTRRYVNGRRLSWCKPGARFYNIGRGSTVDQDALLTALQSGRLDAAYLDVMEPEPLPPEHPLWTAPNCFLTPHAAGGHDDQDEALVRHFLANLDAFLAGRPMVDRVM